MWAPLTATSSCMAGVAAGGRGYPVPCAAQSHVRWYMPKAPTKFGPFDQLRAQGDFPRPVPRSVPGDSHALTRSAVARSYADTRATACCHVGFLGYFGAATAVLPAIAARATATAMRPLMCPFLCPLTLTATNAERPMLP